jgi:hypothetical protein
MCEVDVVGMKLRGLEREVRSCCRLMRSQSEGQEVRLYTNLSHPALQQDLDIDLELQPTKRRIRRVTRSVIIE